MQRAKIRLSAKEMALVLDPAWILTKRSVMGKTAVLLGSLADGYRVHTLAAWGLPDHLKGRFPKISRGENYQGLPYMILDYPAIFDKTDVFAIRTLFWWGHYFSLTLHLKGEYLGLYLPKVIRGLQKPSPTTWYVSVSENEWVHAVQKEDYVNARDISGKEWIGIAERPFIKVVSILSLEQWDDLHSLLETLFLEILGWLGH